MIAWLVMAMQALMIFGIGFRGVSTASPEATVLDQRSVKSGLEGRSFRQSHPSKDADFRKGVVLDFTGPVVRWAQYAEEGHAVSELEIRADDYRVSGGSGGLEVVDDLENPIFTQRFPSRCENYVKAEESLFRCGRSLMLMKSPSALMTTMGNCFPSFLSSFRGLD